MRVFVADLHKNRTRLRQQVARDREAISKVTQITMNAIAPCVAKSFNLFRLPSYLVRLSVCYISASRAPLKIAIEFNSIGWIK